ncbi:hypothetical protein [Umezawaea tangerina]|uniref:Uncharacterized protein n=1 Tax=Umezawaea tangerina TaxID=84725 RepID=A0A2T0TA07_9PSEU|nr:hypothetical protein [Umezawaea tangerina]PRY42497.1 hypothetical protein CLV43_104331 [Umezawaea tangerina]
MNRQLIERLATSVVFTAVQVGAMAVILVRLHVSGVLAAATAFVMAGALMAVHDAWGDVRAARRGARGAVGSTESAESSGSAEGLAGMPSAAQEQDLVKS